MEVELTASDSAEDVRESLTMAANYIGNKVSGGVYSGSKAQQLMSSGRVSIRIIVDGGNEDVVTGVNSETVKSATNSGSQVAVPAGDTGVADSLKELAGNFINSVNIDNAVATVFWYGPIKDFFDDANVTSLNNRGATAGMFDRYLSLIRELSVGKKIIQNQSREYSYLYRDQTENNDVAPILAQVKRLERFCSMLGDYLRFAEGLDTDSKQPVTLEEARSKLRAKYASSDDSAMVADVISELTDELLPLPNLRIEIKRWAYDHAQQKLLVEMVVRGGMFELAVLLDEKNLPLSDIHQRNSGTPPYDHAYGGGHIPGYGASTYFSLACAMGSSRSQELTAARSRLQVRLEKEGNFTFVRLTS
jgi:hypothetical protein